MNNNGSLSLSLFIHKTCEQNLTKLSKLVYKMGSRIVGWPLYGQHCYRTTTENCDKIHFRWFVMLHETIAMVITNHSLPLVTYSSTLCVVCCSSIHCNPIAETKTTDPGNMLILTKNHVSTRKLSQWMPPSLPSPSMWADQHRHHYYSWIAMASLKINLFVTLTRNQISINLP